MSTSIAADLVRRIREQLRARSSGAMAEFVAAFRNADRIGTGTLDAKQFDAALRQCGVFLGMYDVGTLTRTFSGPDGRLSVSGFVSAVVGELSEARRQLVRTVYNALDTAHIGSIPFTRLRQQFQADKHPDVERGIKQPSEVQAEFLLTMRVACGASDGSSVRLQDFERYYQFVGAAYASDELFTRLLQRVWPVPSATAGPGTSTLAASGKLPAVAAPSSQAGFPPMLATVVAVLRDKLMQRSTGAESLSTVMSRAFRFVDRDGSGSITLPEFAQCLERYGMVLDSDQIRTIFSFFDTDGTGRMEYAEFVRLVDDRVPLSSLGSSGTSKPTGATAPVSPAKPTQPTAAPVVKPSTINPPALTGPGATGGTAAGAAAPLSPSAAGPGSAPFSLSGTRKGLSIGINYLGDPQAKLEGCINDTKTVRKVWTTKFGVPDSNIRVLTDDNKAAMPTKDNILKAIDWLVSGAKPGDVLFFHYSGHGSQSVDTGGDEQDQMDETIVPLDYQRNGMIPDDMLHRVLVERVPPGAHLFALMDSCHSGSALDLRCMYRLNDPRKAVQPKSYITLISGCRDDQTSADARPAGGAAGGAMTMSLAAAFAGKEHHTYRSLLKAMHAYLTAGRYDQKPQLSSELPIDLDAVIPFLLHEGETPESVAATLTTADGKPPAAGEPTSSVAGTAATGQRKALSIGINYITDREARLEGCINDTKVIKKLLTTKFGVPDSNIRVLTDDNKAAMPTKDNILKAIDWLVSGAKAGDVLFIHYSGHGGQEADRAGDEDDGMDETLIPCDFRRAGVLTDDELNAALVKPLPPGVQLFAVFDCCHSGTALDLKVKHKFTAPPRSVPPPKNLITLISGCRDDQTSADVRPAGGAAGGAMTNSLNAALSTGTKHTFRTLLKAMYEYLDMGRFDQRPQLSSASDFDIDTLLPLV